MTSATTHDETDSRRTLKAVSGACVVIVFLTFTVYFQVIGFEFVNYDDGAYVTENEFVRSGLTWENIQWAFRFESAEVTGNWHPLTWLSLMTDVSLFGAKPGLLHAINVLFHCANALLLYGVLLLMTGAQRPALFVAAVFAIHPLHVESVAWISERKDVLSTFFCLLAILCHVRFISVRRWPWLAAGLVCFLLSLLSKQMYVTLPFLLLLLDYWPLRRTELLSPDRPAADARRLAQLAAEKLPWLLMALTFCVIAFAGQHRGGAVGSLQEYTILQRCLNAIVCYVVYLRQTFWPSGLAVFYPYPKELPWISAGLAAVFLATLTATAVRLRHRFPELIVGWLWYLGTLVPVAGLIQIGRQRMADRYMYFPIIGLLMAVAWGVARISADSTRRRELVKWVAVLLIAALSWQAHQQTGVWSNSLSLFSHAAEVAESALAHTKLGYDKAQAGKTDAAANHLNRALRIDPDYVAAHSSLGNLCLAEGNPEQAIRHFLKVVDLEPGHAEAHYNLGIIYSRSGQLEQAVRHYQEALIAAPQNAEIHTNMAIAKVMMNHTSDARKHLQVALDLKPQLPQANMLMASLHEDSGRFEQAIHCLQVVLEHQPDTPQLRERLAELFRKTGQNDKADELEAQKSDGGSE